MSSSSRKGSAATSKTKIEPFDLESPWRKWDPRSVPGISINLLCGTTGAGKTVALQEIMKLRQPKRTIICCCSPECYKAYAYNWPFIYCFDELNDTFSKQYRKLLKHFGRKNGAYEQEVRNIMDEAEPRLRQLHKQERDAFIENLKQQAQNGRWTNDHLESQISKAKKEWKKKQTDEIAVRNAYYDKLTMEKREPDIWTAVFDDLSNQKNPDAWDDDVLGEDAKAGRQSIRNAWYVAQALLDMKCANRNQTTTLILYPAMNLNNVKNLFDHWLPQGFQRKKDFTDVLAYFANKGWWIIIDRRASFGKNQVGGANPRDFISRWKVKRDPYIDKYIGCPSYLFFHRLMFDHKRAEQHVFDTAPKLVENSKRAKAAAKIANEGKITKKAQKEAEGQVQLDKKDVAEIQDEFVGLVRNIGPKKETDLLKQVDSLEGQLFAKYFPDGHNPFIDGSRTTTLLKKKKKKEKVTTSGNGDKKSSKKNTKKSSEDHEDLRSPSPLMNDDDRDFVQRASSKYDSDNEKNSHKNVNTDIFN